MTTRPLDGEIIPPGFGDSAGHDEREQRVRARFWPTLRRAARQVPFVEDLVAAYYCALDPRVPMRVRGVLLAALAYFVLPIDAIPDFIFGIGFTDDISVLAGAIAMVATHITEDHRIAARRALAN
jgi:uncharacterized membrane protein YkvA (DUF1232 family)